jgi:hypothetical protein
VANNKPSTDTGLPKVDDAFGHKSSVELHVTVAIQGSSVQAGDRAAGEAKERELRRHDVRRALEPAVAQLQGTIDARPLQVDHPDDARAAYPQPAWRRLLRRDRCRQQCG